MTDENNSIGHRIRQARTALGLTQQALADQLNISVQSVSQWETGRTTPSFDRTMLLGEILGTSGEWLRKGVGKMTVDPPKKYGGFEEFRNRLAREIEWDKHLAWYGQMGLEGAPTEIEPGSILACHDAVRDLFALTIQDSANAPLFEIGDIVIGDTGILARPGDMVFAKLANRDDVIFRQIKAFRRDDSGDLIAELRPKNDDYETEVINISSDFDRIIGVMAEHRRFRRR